MRDIIKVFAPATIANVSCGYDAMGFALANLGDHMVFKKTASPEVKISKIVGAKLTYDVKKNAAGVVANFMLKKSKAEFGIDIEIYKNYKPGSGLGSSAASSAGAAFGVNYFLNERYSKLELTKFAMQGELAACGSAIADNVAASVYGGFVLIRNYEPLDVISIPTPKNLMVVVIHPQIEIRTEDARKAVPETISTKTAVSQWANVGGLISGLYENNYQRISDALVDYVAEPERKKMIPLFDKVRKASKDAGALALGISGSGPAMFALTEGMETAKNVGLAMESVYKNSGFEFKVYTSHIHNNGVELVH